jgi:hypothetical protein
VPQVPFPAERPPETQAGAKMNASMVEVVVVTDGEGAGCDRVRR